MKVIAHRELENVDITYRVIDILYMYNYTMHD